MSLDTETLDPLADPRWERFVTSASDALVFHHPAWISMVNAEYGYPMRAWVLVRDGELIGGLPVADVRSRLTGRRLVALPFCDLCGPVMASDAGAPERERLLELVVSERERAAVPLDIHEAVPGLPGGFSSRSFLHHTIELDPDPTAVEQRFTTSALKRGARKAEKLGLRIERRTDAQALEDFYELHLETRRHQGVPIQSKRFIRRFASMFDRGLGHVVLVVDGDGPTIAAALFVTFNGTLTYKYGASRRSALAKRPNNLLFLDAIRWGCAEGFVRLDLGRTDHDNPGLRDFKRSWGATERELAYTWVADRAPREQGRGVPSFARAAIRRGPPVVGRMVGRALYRHVA